MTRCPSPICILHFSILQTHSTPPGYWSGPLSIFDRPLAAGMQMRRLQWKPTKFPMFCAFKQKNPLQATSSIFCKADSRKQSRPTSNRTKWIVTPRQWKNYAYWDHLAKVHHGLPLSHVPPLFPKKHFIGSDFTFFLVCWLSYR